MSTNGFQQEQICGNKFIINWIIRNISLLFQTSEDESPVASSFIFIATNLKNTEWKLEFYPTGRENTGNPEIFLKRTDVLFEIGDLIVNFKLEAYINYGNLLQYCEEIRNFNFGVFNREKRFENCFPFFEFENFLKKSEDQTIHVKCIITDKECHDYLIEDLTTSTIFKEDDSVPITMCIELSKTRQTQVEWLTTVYYAKKSVTQSIYARLSISTKIDEENNLVKILLATINFPPKFSYKISEVATDGYKLIGRKTCDAFTDWTVFQHEINRFPHSNGVETVTLLIDFFMECSVSHELNRNYSVDKKIILR